MIGITLEDAVGNNLRRNVTIYLKDKCFFTGIIADTGVNYIKIEKEDCYQYIPMCDIQYVQIAKE